VYIHQFRVKNFVSHKSTDVKLYPITVFVGPNGGGKSALFDAILNFSMVARGNIKQAFGPFPFSYLATKYHGAHRIENVGFEVSMSQSSSALERVLYSIEYSQQGQLEAGLPNFLIANEKVRRMPGEQTLFDRGSLYGSLFQRAIPFLENDRSIFAALRTAYLEAGADTSETPYVELAREISRFNKFRLSPYVLAQPSRLPDVSTETTTVPPRIGYEREDLAACLYYLKETKNPSLEVITSRVQGLVPHFQRFEFNLVGPDRIAFQMVFDDERGEVPAVRTSSGLLLFVGLMVLVDSPNRPPVLLIEEPENGLTPTALAEFYKAIRDLAFREPESRRSQVLISSHSPFVICDAWNGEDRDFIYQVKISEGYSVVRKFTEAVSDSGAALRRGCDKPGELGLRTAELVMSGYMS
jgi:AAA domain, putative AbiEii toxin, Type IV TA system